jgi:hypothetical protein
MAERLLLTLEGELSRRRFFIAAFQRQPLARKGWEAMTPVQRRAICWASFTTRHRIQAAAGSQGRRRGAARGRREPRWPN